MRDESRAVRDELYKSVVRLQSKEARPCGELMRRSAYYTSAARQGSTARLREFEFTILSSLAVVWWHGSLVRTRRSANRQREARRGEARRERGGGGGARAIVPLPLTASRPRRTRGTSGSCAAMRPAVTCRRAAHSPTMGAKREDGGSPGAARTRSRGATPCLMKDTELEMKDTGHATQTIKRGNPECPSRDCRDCPSATFHGRKQSRPKLKGRKQSSLGRKAAR